MSESIDESAIDTQLSTLNAQDDTLHLLPLNTYGQVRHIGLYPMHFGGLYDWNLHEGLNVSLSASVFAQFGKHAQHGVGFMQNFSTMYAVPLTNKLSLSVGGYLSNMNWQNDAYRNAGLTAMLGYRFDEHWEGFLYAQKSLTHNVPLYGYYPAGGLMGGYLYDPFYAAQMGAADRIGAGFRYYFNPSFSVSVSFEHDKMPRKRFGSPYDPHSIPPPKE
ncbi:MAG: transporter [Prevotella sp.]|nr:transporter [Prevotella sp.]